MKFEIVRIRGGIKVEAEIREDPFNLGQAEERDIMQIGAIVAGLGYDPGRWSSRGGNATGPVTYYYRY